MSQPSNTASTTASITPRITPSNCPLKCPSINWHRWPVKRLLASTLTCLGLLCCGPLQAQSHSARAPVEDLRILLVAALDAPDGRAQGVLVGRASDFFTQRFQAHGPILVDVNTERRFAQTGCARLKLRVSQAGVSLPASASPIDVSPGDSKPKTRDMTLDIGLNYCRDGTPPKSLAPLS